MVKEPSLPYLPIARGEWIHAFSKGISVKVKCKHPCSGFELALPSLFTTKITATP